MSTSQAPFKQTYDKRINLIKCLQEFKRLFVKFSFLNSDNFSDCKGLKL